MGRRPHLNYALSLFEVSIHLQLCTPPLQAVTLSLSLSRVCMRVCVYISFHTVSSWMSVRRPAEWVGSVLAQEPLNTNFLRNYLSHTLPDFPAPRGHSSAAGVQDQNPRLSMRVCCRVRVSLRVNTCCVCALSRDAARSGGGRGGQAGPCRLGSLLMHAIY